MTALKTYIVSAILAIVFNAQDTLWATPNHPFWHKGHYVEASALHAGDTIETFEGGYSRIQQIIPISGERRVYNITVAENSNYYVGSRGVLVHNDCFLKRLTDSPELMARIDALPDALKGQFIQDFYEAGEDVIKVLRERPGCVRAWEVLIENPNIRKDISVLTSSSKILDNPNIATIISKSDLQTTIQKLAQKGVRCRTCSGGNPAYRYLDEILDDLGYGAVKFGDSYKSVITGFKQGDNFTEGAMWVAEGVRKYPNEFPSNTVFEFTEKTTADGIRRVDVKVTNDGNSKDIFYEFKSVNDVPPTGFATQFVKDMDLIDVTDLSQLKWWFDGNKINNLPKQQFLGQLHNIESSLTSQVKNNLISKYAPGGTFDDVVDVVDRSFNKIFSIK